MNSVSKRFVFAINVAKICVVLTIFTLLILFIRKDFFRFFTALFTLFVFIWNVYSLEKSKKMYDSALKETLSHVVSNPDEQQEKH